MGNCLITRRIVNSNNVNIRSTNNKLLVSAPIGSTVILTNNEEDLTKITDYTGVCEFDVSSYDKLTIINSNSQ